MEPKEARFIKYWLPVIIYAVLIFFVSSVPGEDIPVLFSSQDIIFHIIEYALFAVLLSRALKASYTRNIYRQRFFWVFFLTFVYAITDEFHQSFIANRNASIYDVLIDGVGGFIGGWVHLWRK